MRRAGREHAGIARPRSLWAAACMAAAATSAAGARTGSPAAQVDTVRVVRERLPADILRAPVAATELGPAVFETHRQTGLDAALQFVPGVLPQSRSGGQDVRITVRGFGARGAGDRSNAGTTRGVRILLDGFPLTEPDGRTSLDLVDVGALERVRVVRSNTSALYGPAAGGLLDLVTHAPFAGSFADIGTRAGSFGLVRSQATAGMPLGAAAAARVSASDTRFAGWREHSSSATTALQASVVAPLDAGTELGVFAAASNHRAEQPGPLARAEFDADPRRADPAYVERHNRRHHTLGRVGVRLRHTRSGRRVVAGSGYVEPKRLQRSERDRFRDFQRVHAGGSLLHGWEGPGGRRWLTGADAALQDGAALFYDLGPGGSRGTRLRANKREAIVAAGVFTEVGLRPGSRWDLTLGLRHDAVRYVFQDFLAPHLDDGRTLQHTSPRAAVSLRLGSGHGVYAAVSGGLETPAFNEVNPPAPYDTLTGLNPFLEPARSLTFEIGARGLWVPGRTGRAWVRYDAAAYALEVRDDLVPHDGGAFYTNAGRSRRAGLELGLEWAAPAGFGGRLACTLSRHHYVDYASDRGDFGGHETAGLPWIAGDLRLRAPTPVGGWIETTVQARGGYFADDANRVRVPAYATVSVAAGAGRRLGRTRAEIFAGIDNLLDERHVASVFLNGTDGRAFEPGLPRSALVGLRLRRQHDR